MQGRAESIHGGNEMGEELRDFRDGLIAQALADRDPKQPQAKFADLAGQMLEEAEELSDYMACAFRGSGPRRRNLGIDGYAFDDADDSLCVVIAVFDGTSDPITLTQTAAKTEFVKLTAFLEEALEPGTEYMPQGDQPAADFVELIQSHRGSITRLRLYLVSDGLLSDRIRDWPESEIRGIPVEFHIWDISRFHAAASSRRGREALTVDFAAIAPGGVPCLHASLHQSDYSGYLCVLPGETLAAIYDRYGSRLLEGNVRSFLGKTGKVNKAMRETILQRPGMFFAFNNGIAATATSVDVAMTQDGPRLMQATDLQIVNGGQTTASLAFSRRKDGADLSGIFVQMKLSVVSELLAGELIPKISEYANKQNKVSDSDLFSNHEYHRQLEALSRRIPAPPKPGSQKTTIWFYERARGQYRIETANMSPGERARFEAEHPKDQVINKTDLAKIENSWLRRPVDVSKGAQKNFDAFSKYIVAEWAASPLQFNDEYFRTIVAHAIVFKTLESLVPKQPWYDGGYRANIVTFSIAKLVQIVEDLGGDLALNTPAIWKQQAISAALTEQLLLIAKSMYEVITHPEQGIENVTEWCKKDLAWTKAIDARVEALPEFRNELISRQRIVDAKRDAADDARIDRGIEAVTAVIEFTSARWKEVRQWGQTRNLLTPREDSLLLVAATFGKIPSEKQAEAILGIRAKLQQEGLQVA